MNSDRPYFDPEAPGIRGSIGIAVTVVRLIAQRVGEYLSVYVRAFQELPGRVRGLIFILCALSMLIIIGSVITSEITAYVDENKGPFLDDALEVPHGITKRGDPNPNTKPSDIRPEKFGDYQLVSSEIPDLAVISLPVQCLMNAYSITPEGQTPEPHCSFSYRIIDRAFGRYSKDGSATTDLVVTRFESAMAAGIVMTEMLAYQRSVGQVGNFSVGGVNSVDYMYSAADGLLSFTWRRGLFVFNLSTRSYSRLEDAIDSFPY